MSNNNKNSKLIRRRLETTPTSVSFVERRDDDEYKHFDIEDGKRDDIQAGGTISATFHNNLSTKMCNVLPTPLRCTKRTIRQFIIAIVTMMICSFILWRDINNKGDELLNKQTRHKYLFVGGLQRSMTSSVTESLGSITGYTQMELSNMPKSDLMDKKPWELGMGKLKDEGHFFRNSGGVEGKMVQDVYSNSGKYVDFFHTYCAYNIASRLSNQNDTCFEHKAVSSLIKKEEDLGDNNVTQIRDRLLQEWEPFWDNSSSIRIEKTPENVFMTRWLQAVFGSENTHFLLLMTHPLVWSLKIDKWVVNNTSSLWTFASRIEAWLETYEHLVEWDVPALNSVAITHVERGFNARETVLHFNLPFVDTSNEDMPFLTQGYIKGYCQEEVKDWKGDWSKVVQTKYNGWEPSDLIQKYECRANHFGYTFWGLDLHCNSHIDNDAFGYAPSLVHLNLQKVMPYKESRSLYGRHIIVFGHSFPYGKGKGMERRFIKIIEVFKRMGLIIHYICEECVRGEYTLPKGIISHFGKTYREQVTSMFEYGDECLAEKVVAVVNFFTHVGMKALRKNEVPMEDGFEHEFLIEDMKSYGIHPTVIVISDDVHNERISTIMAEMKSTPNTIEKIQKELREREMQAYAKSDVIVATSEEDGAAFTALASSYQHPTHDESATRFVVAPYTAHATTNPIRPFQERKDQLLIVGNPHGIAISSMRWFLTEVWSSLRVLKSNLIFKIVGKGWKELLSDIDQSLSQFTDNDWANIGIDFLDFVEQEDLDNNLFQESKIFLVPHKNATGVSTKIIEALSRGIPIVTNSWGKHGLNLEAANKSDVLIATDDNDSFIQGVINLLENETVWDNMSRAGLLHVKRHLTDESIFKAMLSAIEGTHTNT